MIKYKRFGDVCKFIRGPFGGSLKKNSFKPEGIAVYEQKHAIYNQFSDIRYFIDEKKFQEMKRFELFPGDLIMSCSGTMGKVAIVPAKIKRGIINQALLKLTPSADLDVEYLKYWMESESFLDSINKKAVGAAIKNVASVKILKEIELPYFEKEKQQQIVKILDQAFKKIDRAIANIEQNIKNAEELFQSKLNEVFSKKGEGWEEKKLGEVAKYDKTKYAEENMPYVGLENIESNTGVHLENSKILTVKSSTFKFDQRHILYGRLRPYLNKVLVPGFEGHCSTEIFPILPKKELHREFLFYWFLTPKTVSKINATWTGARMPRANMNDVIKFKLPIPSLEIQKELANDFSLLKSLTNKATFNYQRKLNDLEQLKKTLLEKAFKGELTKEMKTV